MSGLPRKQSLEIPKVKIHNGSATSLPSSDRSISPASSPRNSRKTLGFKKIIPWRKKSKELLDIDDGEDFHVPVAKDDISIEVGKKKPSMETRGKKLESRKKRSRSVDHLLSDAMFEKAMQPPARPNSTLSENERSFGSPGQHSLTDEESCDSGNDNFDFVDGVDHTERLDQRRSGLRRKIEKTKERMKILQGVMDGNLDLYLQSAKDGPDPELNKKMFEKKNCKLNANLGQMQKKLDKYQKALKEIETHQQRAKTHIAKDVLRGVKSSVKEISGGVRDNVKAGFSGVSKFFNSTENITDSHPHSSKSDSEYYDFHNEETATDQFGSNENGKVRSPSPNNVFSPEEDQANMTANQIRARSMSPKYFEAISDHNPFEAKLKELQEVQVKLQETVEKALSNMTAIAASLQDERYKTQDLGCQFTLIRSHWNDFSELHQNEIMVLRQEMERADERIETVDYRIVERVAEIDESFDTFDARISKIENLHHQQGITVDDYLEQNTQAKAVMTKFLSVLLAILTLLFSIFTLIVHGIAPLTKTRLRLVLTSLLVVLFALWWQNPDHYVVIRIHQNITGPLCRFFYFLASKLPRFGGSAKAQNIHEVT